MSDENDMTTDEATSDLVGNLALGAPIWPCPRYPQDVAFLAFAFDRLRKDIIALDVAFAELGLKVAMQDRTVDFARSMAEQACGYGDSCPFFGARHGRCISCKARTALQVTT